MGASFSLVALIDYFTRRDFLAAGLRPHSVTLPYPYDGGDGKSSSTCTVHYWAPPGEPKLPPLLLIHGFGPWATWQWRCQVGPLSRQFHIIVPDLLLPAEPAAMRRVMQMAAHRAPPVMMSPDFVLRDFIQKLYTNREQLSHVFKGITVGTDKFQVTPLSQEVLIVWGEHDQLFPVEKAFAIQRALDGKARVEIMKETGHAPQLEDPARFNEIVLDFLLAADKHAEPSISSSL